MKKTFSLILFLIAGIKVFCLSGILSKEKDIYKAETKWFEIIYPGECEKSAAILFDNCDKIFEEVTAQYGISPNFKMPVVLTSKTDISNAFFTLAPFNRIVIYDTSSQSFDEIGASFSQSLLSTFKHELTHAVTYNMKNGFWNSFTNVLGDCMLPGAFFVTSGMAEGAAVSSESANGEGRLNNEYAKHYVKQAKIENCFPAYGDVQGAGDNLIPGIQYYFNGAFHQWLQKKYGMEKYGEFWHRVINMNRPGVSWSFKKTYGISVNKAWKQFKEDYYIPEIAENPVETAQVCDFFEKNNLEYSKYNQSGARYFSLTNSEKGIYFCEKITNKVYFISQDNLGDLSIKPKKLFTQKGLQKVSSSSDGKYLAVSYFAGDDFNFVAKIKVYDVENKEFYEINDDGLKDGAIVYNNGNYYLICHRYKSSYNNIIIKKIVVSKSEKMTFEDVAFPGKLNLNEFAGNFIDIGEGYFSYIKKSGLNYSVCISDLKGNLKSQFFMPDGVFIKELSENNGNIYFSWADEGTMPRFGYISLAKGQIFLSQEDISGGIFSPVAINSSAASAEINQIVYIGSFYKENRILSFEFENKIYKNVKTVSGNLNKNNFSYSEEPSNNISFVAEEYKMFDNINHGFIIPFSIYKSEMIGDNYGSTSPSAYLPFGVTYVTSSPWSRGAENLFICSVGWSYLTNAIGFETIFSNGTESELFNYRIDLKTEFDRQGWKQSAGAVSISSAIAFGNISTLFFQNDFVITGGRQNHLNKEINGLNLFTFWDSSLFESFAPIDDNVAINIYDMIYGAYSNIRRMGAGRFEYGGLSFGAGVCYLYDSDFGYELDLGKYIFITSDFTLQFPRLFPVGKHNMFVYNLPTKLNVALLPFISNFGKTGASIKNAGYSVLDTNIETVLFGIDIQKSVPFFGALFLQDFYISAGYTSTIASYKGTQIGFQLPYVLDYLENLSNGKSIYLDSIYLKASLELAANVGVLANPNFKLNLYSQVIFPINVLNPEDKKIKFEFGFQGSF